MILKRSDLARLILEESTRLDEDCGCGGSMSDDEYMDSTLPFEEADYELESHDLPDEMSNFIDNDDYYYDNLGNEVFTSNTFLSRDEALKAVVALAQSTSCSVTKEALLGVVRNLM